MDFFNSLISFIEILFNFVVNIITSLLSLFSVLGSVVTIPVVFTGLLFPAIVTSMTVVISIGVLYKIVGR